MATLSDPTAPPPADPADDRDPDAPPPFPWWAPFLVGIGVYVVLGVVVAAIAIAAGWDDLPDRFILGATLLQDAVLIGIAVAVAKATSRRPRWDLGLRRIKPGRGLLWAAGLFLAFFAFLLVWQLLLDIEESDDLAQELGAKDSTVNLIAVAFLVALVAPIAEELFFRGFMFGALRGDIGWIKAAIVTGIVFGIVHAGGTDAVFLVPLAVLGALLCVLYQRTGSILPCVGVHAFNNALALGSTLSWSGEAILAAVVVAPLLTVSFCALIGVPRLPAALPPTGGPGAGGPPPPDAPREPLWAPPQPPAIDPPGPLSGLPRSSP